MAAFLRDLRSTASILTRALLAGILAGSIQATAGAPSAQNQPPSIRSLGERRQDPPRNARCIDVTGPRVRASDLVEAIPEFAKLPPDQDLGYSPAPGHRRWFQPLPAAGSDDRRGGTMPGFRSPDFDSSAAIQSSRPDAGPVCIARAMRMLSAPEIQAALDLPPETDIRSEVVSWSTTTIAEGTVHFPQTGAVPATKESDVVLWRGFVSYEGNRKFPLWARIKLTSTKRCIRVSREVPRGSPIEAVCLRSEACDARAILGRAVRAGDAITGRVAARRLLRGEWLLETSLAEPMLIRAKEPALLVVRSGAVRISVPVVAEQAGNVGDRVWVRTEATRIRLPAEVSSSGVVVAEISRNGRGQTTEASDSAPGGRGAPAGRKRDRSSAAGHPRVDRFFVGHSGVAP